MWNITNWSGKISLLPSSKFWYILYAEEIWRFFQFVIYKEIKEKFGDHLWLDVVSKCDLLKEFPITFITEDPTTDSLELASYRKSGPEGSIHVSVTNEIRLDEVCYSKYFLPFAHRGSPLYVSFDTFGI